MRRRCSSARRPAPTRTGVGPAVRRARRGSSSTTLLAEAGLAREEIFITNVLKARPPGNRDPRADEVAHSWPWLEAQLA